MGLCEVLEKTSGIVTIGGLGNLEGKEWYGIRYIYAFEKKKRHGVWDNGILHHSDLGPDPSG